MSCMLYPATGPIEFSDEAVFLVLMNLEACNPVLRSQARSSLAFYESNE